MSGTPAAPHRCPFVAAVAAGNFPRAVTVAYAGPSPADPGTIPVLIRWATALLDGELDDELAASGIDATESDLVAMHTANVEVSAE